MPPADGRQDAPRKPTWLDDILNADIETSMESGLFQTVKGWIKLEIGLELTNLVWAITVLIPVTKYGRNTFDWMRDNISNKTYLDMRKPEAMNLQIWASKQPVNTLLSWLSSFETIELRSNDHNCNLSQQDISVQDFVRGEGHRFFLFQGIPFILHKPRGSSGHLTLRCLWGSSQPIKDLLNRIESVSVKRETLLHITFVRHSSQEGDTTAKRALSIIDMEPVAKQELLTDLQSFFDHDTKRYYRNNGVPYRRGYLLYGPPGTGKTSLSQAIASEYDLELFVIDLTDMNDSRLQYFFKELPSRCVVLMEDIDAAGIVREDFMKSQARDEGQHEQDSNADQSDEEDDEDEEQTGPVLPKKKTKVTLSGLLNVLDGPGAKEGRLVILTTNAPDALDEAVHRPGRIDRRIYLGYSTAMSAACTFSRMYGNDSKVNFHPEAIERLSKLFGKKVPLDLFTPCEIQESCMTRRGRPTDAVKDFPKFVEERISGKHKFEYDIKRRRQPRDAALEFYEGSTETDDAAFAILERSLQKQASDAMSPKSSETHESAENGRQPYSGFTPSSTAESRGKHDMRRHAHGKLPLNDFAGVFIDPDLAYGTYYPAQDRVKDRPDETLQRGLVRLLGISVPDNGGVENVHGHIKQKTGDRSMELAKLPPHNAPGQQQHNFPGRSHHPMPTHYPPSFSGHDHALHMPTYMGYGEQGCAPLHFGSEMHRVNHAQASAFPPHPVPHGQPLNPAATAWQPPYVSVGNGANLPTSDHSRHLEKEEEDGKSDFFYTPCSTKSQIAETFQHHRRPSHPDLAGRANAFPYHLPVNLDPGKNPWNDENEELEHTTCLRALSPKPLEEGETLHIMGGPNGDEKGQWGRRPSLSY